MKKNIFAWAIGSLLLLSTSCADDEIINNVTPAEDGSEVIFGARAGFENGKPDSRTEYSGVEYTYNGKSYERIDWVFDTDKVEIYCPQGANTTSSHYYVRNASIDPDNNTPNADTETDHLNDYSYLERISTEGSIQWNGDGVHDFYAMYPSSMMFTEDPTKTLETGVYLNETTVTGVVPFSQQPLEVIGEGGHYVAKPNMNFAYMVAKSQAKRAQGSVDLTFVPIVTAVEMTLQYPENGTSAIHIGEIQVTSSKPITGKFTADLAGWDPAKGYPTCTNDANNVIETIQITTRIKNGNTYEPIKLDKGNTLTFTVFLLPGSNVEDLTVRLSDTGAGYASKKMTFTGAKIIRKNVKNIVTGVNLPAPLTVNAANWMVRIDDDGKMGRLSLPGTGNSFSYLSELKDGEDTEYYKSQLITFEEQWNLGVRAFEITTDRPSEGTTSLGTKNVICNGASVGKTVRNVFDMILDTDDDKNLEDGLIGPASSETAMIILTYQPDGSSSNPRDPSVFMNSLNVLYDELVTAYGDRFVLYSPDLTMAQARGKVMIVVRPTQLDEDDATSRSNALTAVGTRKILVVDGCGTGKDKWGRRGYKVNGSLAADIKDCKTGAPLLEKYMLGQSRGWSNDLNNGWSDWAGNVQVGSSETCDYKYKTQVNFYIWFQEWARVVDNDLKINLSDTRIPIVGYTWYYNVWWRSSYDEKLASVIKTFDMAISDIYKDSYVFINSLCGYYIDKTKSNSYAPYMDNPASVDFDTWPVGGQCGRIGDLAEDLNRDFYNHVLEVGLDSETGPTGVVLMERVSKNVSDGGAHYLPGTIIANNFKYGSASDNLGGNGNPSGGGDETEEGGEG